MSALVETAGSFSVLSPLSVPAGVMLGGAARMRCLPTGADVPLLHLAFSPRGRMLAAGCDAGRVRLWSLPAGGLVPFSPRQLGSVRAVAFVTENLVAAAGGDWLRRVGELRLWNTATGQEEVTLWRHRSPITALAVSPDGSRLVAGGGDGTVRLWDTETWTETTSVTVHDDEVLSLAWSADGTILASAGADHVIQLLDTDLEPRRLLHGHEGAVRSVTFSLEGDALASVEDAGLRRWDARTGQSRGHWASARGGLRAVRFAPDGQTLLTVGALRQGQAELRAWDPDSGSQVLYRHRDGLSSLAIAPDGRSLALGDQAGAVLLWPLSEFGEPAPSGME
jgi:WD40 repeat protein